MIAEELWATGAAFFFNFFKEVSHGPRIESSVIHDVGAQQVGFRLGLPRVLQKIGAHPERDPQLSHLRQGTASHQSAKKGERQLRHHLLAGSARTVALHNVGNFVRHDARQLGFIIGGLDCAQIHVDGSAGKRERVDLFLVYNVEAVGPFLAWSARRQFSAEALHILSDRTGIRQNGKLLANLLGSLLSGLDFLLRGKHVKTAGRLDPGWCGNRPQEQDCQVPREELFHSPSWTQTGGRVHESLNCFQRY